MLRIEVKHASASRGLSAIDELLVPDNYSIGTLIQNVRHYM